MSFTEITPAQLAINPFTTIGKEWMLVAAEKDGKTNALTASWGGMGVLWNKNMIFVFIRESRYTKEFIDAAETFSVTVFDHEKYAAMLGYMGKVSGRSEDKIAAQALTVKHSGNTPYFEEGKLVFVCKKIAHQPLLGDCFVDSALNGAFYADRDYHTMYCGEILAVLQKD